MDNQNSIELKKGATSWLINTCRSCLRSAVDAGTPSLATAVARISAPMYVIERAILGNKQFTIARGEEGAENIGTKTNESNSALFSGHGGATRFGVHVCLLDGWAWRLCPRRSNVQHA